MMSFWLSQLLPRLREGCGDLSLELYCIEDRSCAKSSNVKNSFGGGLRVQSWLNAYDKICRCLAMTANDDEFLPVGNSGGFWRFDRGPPEQVVIRPNYK